LFYEEDEEEDWDSTFRHHFLLESVLEICLHISLFPDPNPSFKLAKQRRFISRLLSILIPPKEPDPETEEEEKQGTELSEFSTTQQQQTSLLDTNITDSTRFWTSKSFVTSIAQQRAAKTLNNFCFNDKLLPFLHAQEDLIVLAALQKDADPSLLNLFQAILN
jgi:hypothetical protein